MDKRRIHVPAGQGQISDGKGVDMEGFLDAVLALVDTMKGRRVDDDIRPDFGKDLSGFLWLGNVKTWIIERENFLPFEGAEEVSPQLSVGTDQSDLHGKNCMNFPPATQIRP
jgi:hypothetical protein